MFLDANGFCWSRATMVERNREHPNTAIKNRFWLSVKWIIRRRSISHTAYRIHRSSMNIAIVHLWPIAVVQCTFCHNNMKLESNRVKLQWDNSAKFNSPYFLLTSPFGHQQHSRAMVTAAPLCTQCVGSFDFVAEWCHPHPQRNLIQVVVVASWIVDTTAKAKNRKPSRTDSIDKMPILVNKCCEKFWSSSEWNNELLSTPVRHGAQLDRKFIQNKQIKSNLRHD